MEEKKKVLKSLYNRMPEKKIGKKELRLLVKKKMPKKFKQVDVDDFIEQFMKVVSEKLTEGYSVVLPDLLVLYPMVKPGKIVMKMRSKEGEEEGLAQKGQSASRMWMTPRWVLKMRIGNEIKNKLLLTDPTEEEVANLYRD